MDYLKRSWAVINLDNLEYNFNSLKNMLKSDCMVMGVVKADAYGHGDKYIAGKLVELGVDWLAVSNIEEALSLRKQNIKHPVLIFGPTPVEKVKALKEHKFTQTVYSMEYASQLHNATKSAGVEIDIHIKVDTGMTRLGFAADDNSTEMAVEEILDVCKMPCFNAKGIFTHFACADEFNKDAVEYTKGQFSRFNDIIKMLEKKGKTFEIKHCCNSAGAIAYPEMHMDMVRPGIILYGLNPSTECAGKIDLKPVMELFTSVSMVKETEKDVNVSYGRAYKTSGKTKIATVAIGYADGYGRELSNRAKMLVNGQYATVIGRVCMDQVMLDVTHIDNVNRGDIVTIVGENGGETLTFDEMAAFGSTINYEKVCLIGKRVPRVYKEKGEDIGTMNYLLDER